jgi:hypothetical protein
MFTLNPLYNKFPRFKKRYHHSILVRKLKNHIIPVPALARDQPWLNAQCGRFFPSSYVSHDSQHTLAFILVKLRLRNALTAKNKVCFLFRLQSSCAARAHPTRSISRRKALATGRVEQGLRSSGLSDQAVVGGQHLEETLLCPQGHPAALLQLFVGTYVAPHDQRWLQCA